MNKTLTSIFGINWRTAITGYAGAIFTACLPYIQNGTFNIKKDWPYLVGAIGAAIFGNVAKDAKVSGLPGQLPTPSQALLDAQATLKEAQNAPTPNQTTIKALQAFVDQLQKQG